MSRLIGSDFMPEISECKTRCSECRRKIEAGQTALVSRRFGKVQKRVCSEECRLTFDDKFWQGKAHARTIGGMTQMRYIAGEKTENVLGRMR